MGRVLNKRAMEEYYEERAGILEFDAGFSRKEAERMARAEVDDLFIFKRDR